MPVGTGGHACHSHYQTLTFGVWEAPLTRYVVRHALPMTSQSSILEVFKTKNWDFSNQKILV